MNLTAAGPMVKILEVYPYLRIHGAAEAIDFYKRVFDAQELSRMQEPGGRIGHAGLKIGGATLMLSDEYPELGIRGPQALGGTSIAIHLHVENVDALMQRAVEAGATLVRKLEDHFYGERSGTVRDPFGHEWLLGEHIEDVTPDEMQRRYAAMSS